MTDLKLPYALNSSGNLIHADHASKDDRYYCPECGETLMFRRSRIPEGAKYHRRNHFAHMGSTNQHCSESLLHKMFKNKIVDSIQHCLESNENFSFKWDCQRCHETHQGDLLKKVAFIEKEYSIDACRPDITLLNADLEPIIVIEIVVTHAPEENVMQFYATSGIVCILIKATSYNDLENPINKLRQPDIVNVCYNPTCERCGCVMSSRELRTDIKHTTQEYEWIHTQFHCIDHENHINHYRCYRCEEKLWNPITISIGDIKNEDTHQNTIYKYDYEQYKKLYSLQTANKLCPKCEHTMKFLSCKKNLRYKCSNCGYFEIIERLA